MMDVSNVTPDILTERLDAEFYRPSFLANHRVLAALDRHTTLGEASTRIKLGYTGPIDDCYATEGALFLTSKNVVGGRVVVGPDTLRIRFDVHNGKLSSTVAAAGDLLFSRTGTVGKAAVLYDGGENYNFAAHLFAIRVQAPFDSGYLSAFFNSPYGRLQSERMQRGTIIQGLSIYDMPGMIVPNHLELAQKYIGDKVRQAEQLRSHADICERAFEKVINNCYPELCRLHVGSAKHSRAPASMLDSSLNPGEFNPDRLMVRDYLRRHGGRAIAQVADVETPVTDKYEPNDVYLGLDSIGSSSGSIVPSTIANEAVVGAVRHLSEGPVISKLRPYLNKVAYIPSWLSGALGSTELLCVNPRESEFGWYLYGVMKLPSTVRQLNPVSTGSTHPRVSRDDVSNLLIPWVDDPISAGDVLRRAQIASFEADRMATAARLLVEALIEGQITEDDLKEARQALERGDQSLDRLVLSRLTEAGIDVVGKPPLFRDLDALYAAIGESQRAEISIGGAA